MGTIDRNNESVVATRRCRRATTQRSNRPGGGCCHRGILRAPFLVLFLSFEECVFLLHLCFYYCTIFARPLCWVLRSASHSLSPPVLFVRSFLCSDTVECHTQGWGMLFSPLS
jgi:hypothetical protein